MKEFILNERKILISKNKEKRFKIFTAENLKKKFITKCHCFKYVKMYKITSFFFF